MADSWNDERLDDFAKHVDQRFDAVDKRFDSVDRRMEEGFNRVDADIRELRTRFDGLQRVLILGNTAIVAALIGLIATQV